MRRLLLIGLSVVASSGLGIAKTYAQSAEAPAPTNVKTDGESLEEVTVTGTRVARAGFDAPTPLTSLSTDQSM